MKVISRNSLLDQAKSLLKGEKPKRPRKMHVQVVGREPYPEDVQPGDTVVKLVKKGQGDEK